MNNKPVAWINRRGKSGEHGYLEWDKDDDAEINTPLYTHPANLTDEEIEEVINRTYWIGTEDEIRVKIARAILKKASEK